ncbi:MAG: hypothetical protein ABF586_10950 [Sporolactobacillus sp.]
MSSDSSPHQKPDPGHTKQEARIMPDYCAHERSGISRGIVIGGFLIRRS